MSVDTYLKKKNLSRYSRVKHGDIEILVTPVLAEWATRVEVQASRFLLWKRFEVWADHRHRPHLSALIRPAVGGLHAAVGVWSVLVAPVAFAG